MREDYFVTLTHILQDMPDGLTSIKHPSCTSNPCISDLSVELSNGKGKLEVFGPFPGMRLAVLQLVTDSSTLSFRTNTPTLILCHCHYGKAKWQDKKENTFGLHPDELFINLVPNTLEIEITYPDRCFSGIIIYIELNKLADSGPTFFVDDNIIEQLLHHTLYFYQKPVILHSCQKIDGIFSVLYHLPEYIRFPYYKLKLQELLLFLAIQEEIIKENTTLSPSKIALIKEIHDKLIMNLDQKYTIEELSRLYLINTSSLKSCFKAVYGMPIATYMKEYRIKQAMSLLLETKESIASIAAMVGYNSQSKFAKAFQEITHSLPSEFRKLNHL